MFRQSDKNNNDGSKKVGSEHVASQTNITNFFSRKVVASSQALAPPTTVKANNFQPNSKPRNSDSLQPVAGYHPYDPSVTTRPAKRPVETIDLCSEAPYINRTNSFEAQKASQRLFSYLPSTRTVTNSQPAPPTKKLSSFAAKPMKSRTSKASPFGGNNGIYVVPRKPTSFSKPEAFSVKKVQSQFMSSSQTVTQKRSAPWGKFNDKPTASQQQDKRPPSYKSRSNYKIRPSQEIRKEQLSPSQLRVVDAIFKNKSNVFFTGSAGTGKSFLLQYIINEFYNTVLASEMRNKSLFTSNGRDSSPALAVTASTGIAAFHIGGSTVHSFAGIGLGQGTPVQLVHKINKIRRNRDKWLSLKYLIIDEISMLDGDLFDKLEEVARIVRQNPNPFGGIQLIIAGDFFQLPPVTRGEPKFCFQSKSWASCITETIVLDQVFRQKDPEFSSILNEARLGTLSSKAIQTFNSLSREVRYPNDGVQATELFATRNEVESSNFRRLSTLPGEVVRFEAKDSGSDEYAVKALDSNTLFPKTLDLKINAQVMLLKNFTTVHPGLVNGSLGVVLDFQSEVIEDEFNDGDSRPDQSTPGSQSSDASAFRRRYSDVKYPLVRFTCGAEFLVTPEESTTEKNNIVVATRKQVPLILSWALSIHKAQGQTIERVKVDLTRIFEKGQAYVALSRATSLQGLQVVAFQPHKVLAHPKVTQYYRDLLAAP